MQGIVKLSLPILLVAVLVSSGCIQDPESIAMTHPIVKDFLEEYPNAQIQMTHYSEEQSSNIIDTIREDCDNPYLEAKSYYKVTIEDEESGLSVLAWIDWDNKIVTCATKSVISDDDTGGSGGGTVPINDSDDGGSSGGGGGPIEPINDSDDGGSGGGGGGEPLPKYPDYLIEEDIGDFEFSEAYEVTPEYKINGDSGSGYRAIYLNYDERKHGFEGVGCSCSTVDNRLVCTYNGEECNGKPYYVEVWVYDSDDELVETIEEDIFERRYIEDDEWGVYENTGISVNLYRKEVNKPVIEYTDKNYKDRGFGIWTNDNKIVKVQESQFQIMNTYLEKFPSDFDTVLKCQDSDGGKNYFETGYTAVIITSEPMSTIGTKDNCYTETQLYEKYCENGEIKTEIVDCPEGCDNKKEICLEITDPPIVTIDTPPDGFFGTEPEGILRAYTDWSATCEMRKTITSGSGGGTTNWKEMEETGGTTHTEPLEFQDETTYKFEVRCHNDYGTSPVVESNYEVRLPDPDYIIQEIVYEPSSPQVGDTLTFYGVIYNQGSGGLYVQQLMENSCDLYYPTELPRGGGGSGNARIAPGDTQNTGSCGYPLTENGTYTMTVKADSSDWITEEDEDNNELSLNVTIAA